MDSDALKDLATSFRNRLRNLEIVTFYETEITPPLTQLVRTLALHIVLQYRISLTFFTRVRLLPDPLPLWILQMKKLYRFTPIT